MSSFRELYEDLSIYDGYPTGKVYPRYRCKLCREIFSEFHALELHLRDHQEETTFIESIYERKEKYTRCYPPKEIEFRGFERYRPIDSRLGLKATFYCTLCDQTLVNEWQYDLEAHKRRWFRIRWEYPKHLSTRLHKTNLIKLRGIPFRVPERAPTTVCSCGVVVGAYSPCCQSDVHKPALPDPTETAPVRILRYKRNRLRYIMRYLYSIYGWDFRWFEELYEQEIEPRLELSHTWIYTLPVPAGDQAPSEVDPEDVIQCGGCGERVRAVDLQDHMAAHVESRRMRILKALMGDSGYFYERETTLQGLLRWARTDGVRLVEQGLKSGWRPRVCRAQLHRAIVKKAMENGLDESTAQYYTSMVLEVFRPELGRILGEESE